MSLFTVLVQRWRLLVAVCTGLVLAPAVSAASPVVVAGYEFEPFVSDEDGVSPAFLDLLNGEQDEYRFEFVRIPAQRRYALMRAGKIDMILFEMPAWGWRDEKVAFRTTREILSGHEAFIARRDRWEAATPVEERLKRHMVLTLGYHYAFAGFNADQKYLKSRFDAIFAESQAKALRHLVAGDADIAVVSDLFLMCAIKADPSLVGQLITVPPPDQDYSLPILIRDKGPVTPEIMAEILDRLKASGKLKAFFDSRGIGDFLTY